MVSRLYIDLTNITAFLLHNETFARLSTFPVELTILTYGEGSGYFLDIIGANILVATLILSEY